MDETLIRGLVIGGMFAVIGIAANLAWKLIRSDSEGARRTRQVIGAGIALLLVLGFITGSASDRTFVMFLAFVIGGVYWIAKGFKKS